VGHVASLGRLEVPTKFVRKLEGKKLLRRPRNRREVALLLLLIKHNAMKTRRSGGIAPHIPNFDSRWR
jgi:hypothetical protein